MVAGDCTRLRQIVVNLVGNAIKFTERGEVVLDVASETQSGDQVELHFQVTDTGIGIPEGKQAAIFGAFEQVDKTTTRRYGGSGLGLTICSRLVAMMGGRIWLESEVGCGSTFHFTVRLGLAAGEPACSPAVPPGLDHLPVLVVNDNETTRRIVEGILRRWNTVPSAAAGADEAMERIEEAHQAGTPCKLVVIDAGMPGTDGFALWEQIRRTANPEPAAIMMLGSGDHSRDIARCEGRGIRGFVLKPIKESDLFDAVIAALNQDAAEDRQAPAPAARARRCRSLRVLLAEDSLVNQKLVAGILERQGHLVMVANNGTEAIDAYRSRPADLILMDIQMPGMDGFEATAAIRCLEKGSDKHVPIIAMTAHAMTGDRERCLEAGMDAYVPKPIRAKALLEVIAGLTGKPPVTEMAEEVDSTSTSVPKDCVDWSVALETVKGDADLLRVVAETFLEDSPRLLLALRQAIIEANFDDLKRLAHTLKGALGYFGARRAVELAYRLEVVEERAELVQAEQVLGNLQEEMAQVMAAMLYCMRGGDVAAATMAKGL